MLEHIRESYDGIYYSLSGFDVVSLFIPYDATRVSKEEQAQLEGDERKEIKCITNMSDKDDSLAVDIGSEDL